MADRRKRKKRLLTPSIIAAETLAILEHSLVAAARAYDISQQPGNFIFMGD